MKRFILLLILILGLSPVFASYRMVKVNDLHKVTLQPDEKVILIQTYYKTYVTNNMKMIDYYIIVIERMDETE